MFLLLVSITVSRALVISRSPCSRMSSTLFSTSLGPVLTPPMVTVTCLLESVNRPVRGPGPVAGFSDSSASVFSCKVKGKIYIYLLLTEFKDRSVSFGLSFFHRHKSKGKKLGSVTYSTDWEDEVSNERYLLYLYWRVSARFGNGFYSRGTASNFWRTSKAKRVNLKSLLIKWLLSR